MDEDLEQYKSRSRTAYFALMGIFPLLFFIVYWATSMTPEYVPFSSGAFFQPYYGEKAFISLVLGIVGFLDMVLLNIWMIPRMISELKGHLGALAMTEMFAVFGFIIGFLNSNPWAALPYIAISFLNHLYVYNKIMAQ